MPPIPSKRKEVWVPGNSGSLTVSQEARKERQLRDSHPRSREISPRIGDSPIPWTLIQKVVKCSHNRSASIATSIVGHFPSDGGSSQEVCGPTTSRYGSSHFRTFPSREASSRSFFPNRLGGFLKFVPLWFNMDCNLPSNPLPDEILNSCCNPVRLEKCYAWVELKVKGHLVV